MNEPLFSVTITTYNRSELLPRALESVLAQTFRDFELIVVDDGSTDDTRDLVAAYTDPRIRYVFQENSGLSAARNRGVAASNGTYVTFLDDDDEALPEWLTRFSGLVDGAQPAVVSCGMLFVDDRGQPLLELRSKRVGGSSSRTKALFRTGAYAVRRDVFDAAGGYAEGAGRSENTEFSIRLVALCMEQELGISSTSEMLLRANRHSSQRGYYEGKLIGAEFILNQHRALFETNPHKHATYLSVAGINAARIGDFRKARQYLIRAIRVRPTTWRMFPHLLMACVPPLGRRFWGSRRKRRLDRAVTASPLTSEDLP